MAKSSVRFKDTVAAYGQLASEIKARQFAPVYLLMGEESYFIDALSDLLSEAILPVEEQAFSQYTIYGREVDAGKVTTLCRQLPMMGSHQVVILKEAQQMAQLDKLSLYTEHPSPTTILVICLKGKSLDKRTTLYKWIQKHGRILESVHPYDSEVGDWLRTLVSQRGYSIDQKALSMLIEHLGTDLAKMAGEVEKLLISLPEDQRKITDQQIEEHVGISKEFNNFELCKAVMLRQTGKALQIADHFARNPKDNPTLLTIMALFTQFRQLFLLNYVQWQSRRKGVPMPADAELMRLTRINNFYALGEMKQAAALWPNKRVFQVLGLLREYDAKSKGVEAGNISDGELRRELLLKIFVL